MKTDYRRNEFSQGFNRDLSALFAIAGWLLYAYSGLGQTPAVVGPPTNAPVASWSFSDNTNWTSDQAFSPIGFTNITSCVLGDGHSLVVATNVPAWLIFNVVEPTTGATNLVLNAPGSLTFWYAPTDWSSTNAGGTGPGQWTQLIDIGEWTSDSSYGYWGLSIDPEGTNLWFLAQDDSGDTYGLSAPISWTTNYFHFVALTYSSTNVSVYLDGELATNDPGGLSVWPSPSSVSGGVAFGSDTNGQMQAGGLFNAIEAYNYPLASKDIQRIFNYYLDYYMLDPYNASMNENIVSAPSNPSTAPGTPNVITGAGDLQWTNADATPVYSSNVWFTNFVVSKPTGGNMNITFTIQGGQPNNYYDVFANSVLSFGTNGTPWAWMGQGTNSGRYILNLSTNTLAFLILGTPQDTDADGLTDAYELLVSKTCPTNQISNLDGIQDGWEILLGLNPTISNFTSPDQRSNYGYTTADWLNTVTGIKSGNVTTDNEGNIQTVSQ